MVASLTMSQASCAWPNERDSKSKANNYEKRASWRRKNINKTTTNKPKSNKRNRASKDESDSGVRVGCPYYVKDPSTHYHTLSCRGAGFKEVAKLRDHLKDIHNISPALQNELNFKQRRFLALKTIKEKWNLAFVVLFPEVPKDEIPNCVVAAPSVAASPIVTAATQQTHENYLKGDEYTKIEDVRKMFYERGWELYKDTESIHVSQFMQAFGSMFEVAVERARVAEETGSVLSFDGMDSGVSTLDVKFESHTPDGNSDKDETTYDSPLDFDCYLNYEGTDCQILPGSVSDTYPTMNNDIMTSFWAHNEADADAGGLEMHSLPLYINYCNNYGGINWYSEPLESQAYFDMSNELFSLVGNTETYLETDVKWNGL